MNIKDILPVVMTFILIGLMLGVGLLIINGLQDSGDFAIGEYNYNDTVILENGTNQTLDYGNISGNFVCLTNSSINLGTGNYTTYYDIGIFEFRTDVAEDITAYNATVAECNYTLQSYAAQSTEETQLALFDLSGWLVIIIIVLAASIIIGIVMKSFTGGGQ